MALSRLIDVDAYLRYLREHPPEATALCQDLLIHVTRFFRDPDSFKALEAHAFPDIMFERSDEPIRIWVPGCATGEEAYSVAIVLVEVLGERVSERKVQIFATDVSEAAIEQARSGTYPSHISADVSPERLKRFFTKADGGYPSGTSIPYSTSIASSSCGMTSGRTKLAISMRRSPVRASASMSRTLSFVGMRSGSFWKPSRGPTSRMRTVTR